VNKAELEKIKASLIARKEELEAELDRLSKEGGVEEDTQDEGDMAAAATMESLRTSLQDTEQEEYQRVIQALKAIEQGTYGICRDCSGEISEKRLKFYPNASRCLACQEAAEGM